MAAGSREQALAALWFDWDGAYQIEHTGDEWRAKRLDRIGGWMTAGDPDELRRLIHDDYALKPVRRPRVTVPDAGRVLGTESGAFLAGG
jgi:hypothetical protein